MAQHHIFYVLLSAPRCVTMVVAVWLLLPFFLYLSRGDSSQYCLARQVKSSYGLSLRVDLEFLGLGLGSNGPAYITGYRSARRHRHRHRDSKSK